MKVALVEQECSECGKHFWVEYMDDGNYDYFTQPCECSCGFSPVSGSPSLSQWIKQLKEQSSEMGAWVPEGYRKVYKSSGRNCCDANGCRQILPDDLTKVNGVEVDGEWYVPFFRCFNLGVVHSER